MPRTLGPSAAFATVGLGGRALFALPLVLLLLVAALPARGADVFSVRGIPVDVTADDAVTAREKAIATGEREGLARLLRQLTAPEDHGLLPSVDGVPLETAVRSLEIASEQRSSTRYIARLNVAYNPEVVRGLLQSAGVPWAEAASPPVLVLPLWQTGQGLDLWDEGNPWRRAWSEHSGSSPLIDTRLPLGDLEDILAVSAEAAASGDQVALEAIAGRYGAGDVAVAHATYVEGSAVRVAFRAYGPMAAMSLDETVSARESADLDGMLALAVTRIEATLGERWKQANLLRYDQAAGIDVTIRLAALGDWVQINRTLEEMPEVRRTQVETFARQLARVRIEYFGDTGRLQSALERSGLLLSQEGDEWQLQRAEVGPQAEPVSAASPPL